MKSFFSYATHGNKLQVDKLSLEGHDYQPGSIYYWQLDEIALQETINDLKGHLELTSYAESDANSEEYAESE